MIPTQAQWAELTDMVLQEVRSFLAAGTPFLEEDELNFVGHPVAWLLHRSRTFFRMGSPAQDAFASYERGPR